MAPQTFLFRIDHFDNCEGCINKVKKAVGVNSLEIDREKCHIKFSTSKVLEKVQSALECEFEDRVVLLSPLNNSSPLLNNQDDMLAVSSNNANMSDQEIEHNKTHANIIHAHFTENKSCGSITLSDLAISISALWIWISLLSSISLSALTLALCSLTSLSAVTLALALKGSFRSSKIMAPQTFVFRIDHFDNCEESIDKLKKAVGVDSLEIDREKCHIKFSTSKVLKEVQFALECEFKDRVVLLSPLNNSSPLLNNQDHMLAVSSNNSNMSDQEIEHNKIHTNIIHGSSRHTLSSANEKTILDDTSLVIPPATSSECQTRSNTNEKQKLVPNLEVEVGNVKVTITINHQQTEIFINPEQQTKITIINKHVVNAQTGRHETSNATKLLKSYHPHGLELKSTRSSYKCNGCKELGFGDRYECKRCCYFLHPDCMFYKETATHEFLEGSIFKFYQKLFHKNRYCDACGMDILGFYYHCEITKKDLHPCCLNLQETVVIHDENFRLCQVLPSECWCCNSKKNKKNYRDEGWCYSLENQDCHFHVYCMKNQLLKWLDGGDGNGAMEVMKHRKAFKTLKWVGKFLEIMFSLLTGNPIPFFTIGLELLQQ